MLKSLFDAFMAALFALIVGLIFSLATMHHMCSRNTNDMSVVSECEAVEYGMMKRDIGAFLDDL